MNITVLAGTRPEVIKLSSVHAALSAGSLRIDGPEHLSMARAMGLLGDGVAAKPIADAVGIWRSGQATAGPTILAAAV